MKNTINEHEMTQKMMEIMRGGYQQINEFINAPNLDTDGQTQFAPSSNQINPADMDSNQQAPQPDDVIELKKGDATYENELKLMRDVVDGSVKFTSFNIYPSDENVVIDGYLEKQASDDSGIFFKMALTASNIETSVVDVELTDTVNEILKRLTGYYPDFEKRWKTQIHEYN